MPSVYDTQTNLAARGKYAPSVNYYATVRQPNAVEPRLEKVKADPINIDFTSLANALTSVKEGEYKLQANALQMEQDMRNAAADRQLKIDLANMEDARARELADKELQNRWNIAKMQDETNRLKAAKESQKSMLTEYNRQATIDFFNDPEVKDGMREYSSGNKSDLEMQQLMTEKANYYAVKYGADTKHILDAAKSGGFTIGIGDSIRAQHEIQKEQMKAQNDQYISIGGILNPTASESDKLETGAKFMGSLQSIQGAISILNNPESSQMEKDMARRVRDENTDNLINYQILSTINTIEENIPFVNNATAFTESSKELLTNQVANQTGLPRQDVRRRIDAMFAVNGVDRILKSIQDNAKENTAFAQNQLQTYLNTKKLGFIKSNDELTFATIFPDMYKNLDDEGRQGALEYMSKSTIGSIDYNVKWTGPDGKEYNGYSFEKIGQDTLNFTEEEVKDISAKLGFTSPGAAVRYLASKYIKDAPKNIADNRVNDATVVATVEKNVSNLTGNPNTNQTYVGESPENIVQIMENVKTCDRSGKCTTEDLYKIADAVKGNDKERLRNLAVSFSATNKLVDTYSVKEDRLRLEQAMAYMNPDQVGYTQIMGMFNKDADPNKHKILSNILDIKNTKMGYVVKDDTVYIDYTQKGWVTIGTGELNRAAEYVREKLKAADLTVDEQIAYYKSHWPNLVEQEESVTPAEVFLRRPLSNWQDLIVGTGAKIDTQLMKALVSIGEAGNNVDAEPMRASSANTEMYTPSTTTTEEPVQSRTGGWVDTATGVVYDFPEDTGWEHGIFNETRDGKDLKYSYKWYGDTLRIQTDDFIVDVETSASPDQVISDYLNKSLDEYNVIGVYKRK